MDLTSSVVTGLSVLTIIGQCIVVLLALAIIFEWNGHLASDAVVSFVAKHALVFMLIVAVIATSGSLFFSEVAGWAPCADCWYQRIFMYPQVILLALALWKRDRGIVSYILILSIIGSLIAIDHYSDQVVAALTPADPLKPCDATGVSCAATPFFHFGYITIPMMAMTAFFLNIIGCITVFRSNRKLS